MRCGVGGAVGQSVNQGQSRLSIDHTTIIISRSTDSAGEGRPQQPTTRLPNQPCSIDLDNRSIDSLVDEGGMQGARPIGGMLPPFFSVRRLPVACSLAHPQQRIATAAAPHSIGRSIDCCCCCADLWCAGRVCVRVSLAVDSCSHKADRAAKHHPVPAFGSQHSPSSRLRRSFARTELAVVPVVIASLPGFNWPIKQPQSTHSQPLVGGSTVMRRLAFDTEAAASDPSSLVPASLAHEK